MSDERRRRSEARRTIQLGVVGQHRAHADQDEVVYLSKPTQSSISTCPTSPRTAKSAHLCVNAMLSAPLSRICAPPTPAIFPSRD